MYGQSKRTSEPKKQYHRPRDTTSDIRMTPIKLNSLFYIIITVIHNSAFNIQH